MRLKCRLIITCLMLFSFHYAFAANLKVLEQDLRDSMITTKITAKFTKNIHLNPLKIGVKTNDGIVSLKGFVKDESAFEEAMQLVKETKNVKSIDASQLRIKVVNSGFTDAYITAKVEAAILKAKIVDDSSIPLIGINASTDNGVVTLSGDVKKNDSISAILKRISMISGIKKIVTNLQINPQMS